MSIKTFVFLDCETTGLPYQEHNTTKITELCLTAVQANHIELGVFPRVQNKISLSFNPRKLINYESTNITGLNNYLLEQQPEFNEKTVSLIQDFLNLQEGKICFVAHNGKRFDYPILRSHIEKTKVELNNIMCVDTLEAFKQLCVQEQEFVLPKNVLVHLEIAGDCYYTTINEEPCSTSKKIKVDEITSQNVAEAFKMQQIQLRNETTPQKQKISSVPSRSNVKRRLNYGTSYKLVDVYKRLTAKEPIEAHRAENDVSILIECCAVLGEKFVNWANQNATQFCDIPMMVPGRKIGT